MRARTMRTLILISTLMLPPLVFAACEPEEGDPPLQAMVDLQDAGSACPRGGILVLVGVDANRNGTLDESEISDSAVICNGADGADGANGANGSAGVVNIEDLKNRNTHVNGELPVIFPTPCSTQVPDLIYARAVLTQTYDDPTPPGIYLPAGTVMSTTILSKSKTGFTMRVMGPEGQTIRNTAIVDVFYIAVEFAQ